MTIKDQILDFAKKIVGVYSEEQTIEPITESTEHFNKTYSDNELKISQREVGGRVEMIGADDQLSDVPDGDYEMADGFTFTVKAGQIASIEGQEKQPEEPVKEEEVKAAEDAPMEAPSQPNDVEELKAKIANMEAAINQLQEAVNALSGSQQMAATKEDVETFSKEVKELNATIKQLASIPAEFSKTSNSNKVKDKKEETLMALGAILSRK